MAPEILRVKEDVKVQDTIFISPYVGSMTFDDGWFPTFAALARAGKVSFFNVRNRAHGLAYNTQSARDQSAEKIVLTSINLEFLIHSSTKQIVPSGESSFTDPMSLPWFRYDLPHHCGTKFFIQKDEVLAGPATMYGAGTGIVGGGAAIGEANGSNGDMALLTGNDGVAELQNGFPLPKGKIIPLHGTYAFELELNEYARDAMGKCNGPGYSAIYNSEGDSTLLKPLRAAIRVTLNGKRYVQREGEYTA